MSQRGDETDDRQFKLQCLTKKRFLLMETVEVKNGRLHVRDWPLREIRKCDGKGMRSKKLCVHYGDSTKMVNVHISWSVQYAKKES